MLGRIRREAESITINGSGIQGVQNIAAQYDSVAAPIRNLGIQEIQFAPEGPQTASLQVNSLFTHTLDPGAPVTSLEILRNFTGDAPFSGIVNYGAKNFIFTEGYMDSYGVSCAIGEVPQISTTSTIYGTFGTGSFGYIPADAYPSAINVAGSNSIAINLDEFTTNRVSSFNVSINTPRVPIYALNSSTPNSVIAGTPVEVNVSFSLSVDDYQIKNMRFVPEETVFKNTIITINKNNSETELLNYTFDNMLLMGEVFNADVGGEATVDFSLRSYILR
jgi:hypothetical protein